MSTGYFFLGDITSGFSFDENDTTPFVDGDWFQLAKSGTFFSPVYGKVTISEDDLRKMLRNFREVTPKAPTQLPIDYDHKSDNPEMHAAGDAKAAGWVEDLELRENDTELWCLPKWTRPAAKMIAAGEYRFVSPYFLTNYLDKASGKKVGPTLKAVAITNRPFLEGMQEIPAPAIAASEATQKAFAKDKRVAVPWRRAASTKAVAHGRIRMADEDDGEDMAETPSLTCPHCGAAVSNDGSHVKKGAKELDDADGDGDGDTAGGDKNTLTIKVVPGAGDGDKKKVPAPAPKKDDKVAPADLKTDDKEDDVADEKEMSELKAKLAAQDDTIRQLTEKNSATEKALSEIQKGEKKKTSDALIARALTEGKVTPALVGEADKPGWARAFADRDPEGFEKWLENAPKMVEFGEKGTSKEEAADGAASTAINIDKLAQVKMSENAKLAYADAVKVVLQENHALAETYDRQMIGERHSPSAAAGNIRRL